MQQVLEKGILYLILAAVVAVVGIFFAVCALVVITTSIGNLTFWPVLVSAIFGFPLDPGSALAIGTTLLLVIVAGLFFFPSRMEKFLELFATIWVTGVFALMWLGLLGALPFVFLKGVLAIPLPGWSILPLGVAMAWLLINVSRLRGSS